jgi:hypothetical protein
LRDHRPQRAASSTAFFFVQTTLRELDMEHAGLYAAVKAVALLVLVLMLVAILYAGYISTAYWAGIGV